MPADAALRSAVFTSLTRAGLSKSSSARDRCDTELTGYAEQSSRITYVFAVEEVGLEEPFRDQILCLQAVFQGRSEQHMPPEGVRCTLHQVMAKSDSDLHSRSGHLCIEPLRLFPTPELCRAVQSPVEAFDRHLGVELEWMPTDLELFFPRSTTLSPDDASPRSTMDKSNPKSRRRPGRPRAAQFYLQHSQSYLKLQSSWFNLATR